VLWSGRLTLGPNGGRAQQGQSDCG
jgi:hypothetical protein